MTSAETAYLFRHALLRDAAYELQLPADRARLHELAFFLIEEAFGGRAPEPPPLDAVDPPPCPPHRTDSIAAELAEHSRLAGGGEGEGTGVLCTLYRLYLRRAAEYLERAFRPQAAAQAWQSLSGLVAGAAGGECQRRAGVVLAQAGQPVAAQSAFMQALEMAREVGNRRGEGVALGNLAGVYRETGRVDQAERTYELSLAIAREISDRRCEGAALGNLAIVYYTTGRMEQAERVFEQALAIHREVGNRRYEGIVLGNLASVYQENGRLDLAERTQEQALAIAREVSDRRAEGIALSNLAIVYHETGRPERAERIYEQALAIHREIGNRHFEGLQMCACATYLALQNRPEQARECWQSGAAILRELGDTAEFERLKKAMRQACAKAGLPPLDETGASGGDP
jgi:tetratricopeptide (TPR) repeat protein